MKQDFAELLSFRTISGKLSCRYFVISRLLSSFKPVPERMVRFSEFNHIVVAFQDLIYLFTLKQITQACVYRKSFDKHRLELRDYRLKPLPNVSAHPTADLTSLCIPSTLR